MRSVELVSTKKQLQLSNNNYNNNNNNNNNNNIGLMMTILQSSSTFMKAEFLKKIWLIDTSLHNVVVTQ